MTKGLILLVACIALVSSVQGTQKAPLKGATDVKSFFAEIDQHHFGNALISMLAIHTAAGSPIDQIDVLLAQIRQELLDQQASDDEANLTNQANCERLLTEFDNLRIYHLQERDNAQQRLVESTAALEQAEKDLAATITAIDVNARRLEEGQATRDLQHREYEVRMDDYEQAISAVDEATTLVQHLKSGSSFVQLKGRFARVQTKLNEQMKKSKHSHLYTPIIASLTQLAAKADQEQVRKILALLADLRSNLVNNRASDQATEETQAADWARLKADLEAERETLLARRSSLESAIETYKRIIIESQEAIEYHQLQYEQANDNWNNENEQCEALSRQYLLVTQARAREIDIVTRLVEHFETKLKGLKEYMVARPDEF